MFPNHYSNVHVVPPPVNGKCTHQTGCVKHPIQRAPSSHSNHQVLSHDSFVGPLPTTTRRFRRSSLPPSMSLTPEQTALKHRFDIELGPDLFDESWSRLLKHSPEMFAASLRLTSVPKKKGYLSPKIQSLVSLAVSAATTYLHVPSVHKYTRAALVNGATKAEIIEVLCLTSTLGIHAGTTGIPILCEVLAEQGKPVPSGVEGMNKEQLALKTDFEQKRGYWNSMWNEFVRLSPEFFDAYTELSSVPWTNEGGKGVLEPKVCEFPRPIYVLVYDMGGFRANQWVGQRTHILRFRYSCYSYVSAGAEAAHEECAQLWRDSRGNHGGS